MTIFSDDAPFLVTTRFSTLSCWSIVMSDADAPARSYSALTAARRSVSSQGTDAKSFAMSSGVETFEAAAWAAAVPKDRTMASAQGIDARTYGRCVVVTACSLAW